MNRRDFFRRFVAGGALLTTGCISFMEDPGPLNFGIVNRREQTYDIEYTLWDNADEVIIDGSVDIAPRPSGPNEQALVAFEDLIRVKNGDEVDARIQVDGKTFEETYEVTCNQSENAENNFFFRIRHPEAPIDNETGMEFSGSECGV